MKTIKRKCPICERVLPLDDFPIARKRYLGHTTRCKKCTRVYRLNYYYKNHDKFRKIHQEYYQKNKKQRNELTKRTRDPIKEKARVKLRYYVKTGKIKRLPCEVCGDKNVHAHHPDYSKPLEVIWLCHTHHYEQHRKYSSEYISKEGSKLKLNRSKAEIEKLKRDLLREYKGNVSTRDLAKKFGIARGYAWSLLKSAQAGSSNN